jgi:hypothetical protein
LTNKGGFWQYFFLQKFFSKKIIIYKSAELSVLIFFVSFLHKFFGKIFISLCIIENFMLPLFPNYF